ncbi:MAG: hypothetical protein M0P61_05900 [Ignavibacteriaceae bacterium]|nr:hypothetical protein [Ignavibacteriaceae bacterium]
MQKNIPEKIGDYFFDFVEKYEEGDVQLRYEGEHNGFFTLTIYNSGLAVPDNLEDSIMLSEFENCINVIYDMETVKRLQNVKLLVNEPYYFENEKEPKFLSAVFNYDRCF